MKKRLISLVCAIICLSLTASLWGGLAEAVGEAENGKATRTIMLYDCGADLESSYAMATWNLYQILEAEIPSDINVVVMTGGALRWQTEPEYLEGAEVVSPNRENQVWLCSGKNAANAENGHGKMTLLDCPAELKNANMASEEALSRAAEALIARWPLTPLSLSKQQRAMALRDKERR